MQLERLPLIVIVGSDFPSVTRLRPLSCSSEIQRALKTFCNAGYPEPHSHSKLPYADDEAFLGFIYPQSPLLVCLILDHWPGSPEDIFNTQHTNCLAF